MQTPARHRWIGNGFTLLEMLVVLVITALISTLLIQGLGQALALREGFSAYVDDLEHGTLRETWFRHSVQGLIPDYPPTVHTNFFQAATPFVFKGNSLEFSGLTLAALDADNGVPMPFAWLLVREDETTLLHYRNSRGEVWEVWRWHGDSGTFVYIDRDGKHHPQWPPAGNFNDFPDIPGLSQLPLFGGGESAPQLPRAIMLYGQGRQRPFVWFGAIAGRDTPPLDYRLMD
jgi:general secretion pathway protein J